MCQVWEEHSGSEARSEVWVEVEVVVAEPSLADQEIQVCPVQLEAMDPVAYQLLVPSIDLKLSFLAPQQWTRLAYHLKLFARPYREVCHLVAH